MATVIARVFGVTEITPQMFMIRPPADIPETEEEANARNVEMLKKLLGAPPEVLKAPAEPLAAEPPVKTKPKRPPPKQKRPRKG